MAKFNGGLTTHSLENWSQDTGKTISSFRSPLCHRHRVAMPMLVTCLMPYYSWLTLSVISGPGICHSRTFFCCPSSGNYSLLLDLSEDISLHWKEDCIPLVWLSHTVIGRFCPKVTMWIKEKLFVKWKCHISSMGQIYLLRKNEQHTVEMNSNSPTAYHLVPLTVFFFLNKKTFFQDWFILLRKHYCVME